MKILNWLFGTTLKSISSRIGIGVLLVVAGLIYNNYTTAIKDYTRIKIERDKLIIEGQEQRAYTAHVVAQNDSLNNALGIDKRNYDNTTKDLQSLIQQQGTLIKEKDNLISDMRKNLKCKNIFGKIVDC